MAYGTLLKSMVKKPDVASFSGITEQKLAISMRKAGKSWQNRPNKGYCRTARNRSCRIRNRSHAGRNYGRAVRNCGHAGNNCGRADRNYGRAVRNCAHAGDNCARAGKSYARAVRNCARAGRGCVCGCRWVSTAAVFGGILLGMVSDATLQWPAAILQRLVAI